MAPSERSVSASSGRRTCRRRCRCCGFVARPLITPPRVATAPRSCSQKPTRPAEMHDHRRDAGQRAVGIALADGHPQRHSRGRPPPRAAAAPPPARLTKAATRQQHDRKHQQRHHLPDLRDARGASAHSWRGRGHSRDTGKQAAERGARIVDHMRLAAHPDPVAGGCRSR